MSYLSSVIRGKVYDTNVVMSRLWMMYTEYHVSYVQYRYSLINFPHFHTDNRQTCCCVRSRVHKLYEPLREVECGEDEGVVYYRMIMILLYVVRMYSTKLFKLQPSRNKWYCSTMIFLWHSSVSWPRNPFFVHLCWLQLVVFSRSSVLSSSIDAHRCCYNCNAKMTFFHPKKMWSVKE